MKIKYLISILSFLVASAYSIEGQQITDSFPSPGDEPRGLAWDGEYLWCADAGTDSVYKLDPSDGTIVYSFSFSIGSSYGGITWDDGNIWIANGGNVYEVNPSTGQSLSYFHCVYG